MLGSVPEGLGQSEPTRFGDKGPEPSMAARQRSILEVEYQRIGASELIRVSEFAKRQPCQIENPGENRQLDEQREQRENDTEQSQNKIENRRDRHQRQNRENYRADCLSHKLTLLLKPLRIQVLIEIPNRLQRAIRDRGDRCFSNFGPSARRSFAFFQPLEEIDRIVLRAVNADQFPPLRAELIEVAFEREIFTAKWAVRLFSHTRIIFIARGRKIDRASRNYQILPLWLSSARPIVRSLCEMTI